MARWYRVRMRAVTHFNVEADSAQEATDLANLLFDGDAYAPSPEWDAVDAEALDDTAPR